MERIDAKIERINVDVEKLLELYDFAEKLYPYERIRGPR
jgi:hypothetical protein